MRTDVGWFRNLRDKRVQGQREQLLNLGPALWVLNHCSHSRVHHSSFVSRLCQRQSLLHCSLPYEQNPRPRNVTDVGLPIPRKCQHCIKAAGSKMRPGILKNETETRDQNIQNISYCDVRLPVLLDSIRRCSVDRFKLQRTVNYQALLNYSFVLQ